MPTSEPVLPILEDDSRPFWEAAKRGELWMQQCSETQRFFFPPRPMSPWAPHARPVWAPLSGRGTIWSHVVPHPPLLPAFAEQAPFNVIVVALEEDPTLRMVGNLVTHAGARLDAIDPSTIEIGEPVRVVFEALNDEIHLPRWVRA